jgi:hypothetical protein
MGKHLFCFALIHVERNKERGREVRKKGRRKVALVFEKKEREREGEKEERREIKGRRKKEKEGEQTVVGEHLFYFASRHEERIKEKSREGRMKERET